jgi:hypothetical protein
MNGTISKSNSSSIVFRKVKQKINSGLKLNSADSTI